MSGKSNKRGTGGANPAGNLVGGMRADLRDKIALLQTTVQSEYLVTSPTGRQGTYHEPDYPLYRFARAFWRINP